MPAIPASLTPTVAEFLDASVAEYAQSATAGDLVAFTQNGVQLAVENLADGIQASAWLTPAGQVVIAYEGTLGMTPSGFNAGLFAAQFAEDQQASAGLVTAGETDALAFARRVLAHAATQGISSADVFVTGHSLGAIQAEYVAQQTGLGGIAFEGTGIPRSPGAIGTGANFVDVLTYGDPIAFDASDVQGEQPIAPAYSAAGGTLPHYGQLLFTGDPAWQAALTADANSAQTLVKLGLTTAPAAVGLLLAEQLIFHLPQTQAHDLGVSLPASAGVVADVGTDAGPVLNVARDTLPQLLQYIAATNGNRGHGTALGAGQPTGSASLLAASS